MRHSTSAEKTKRNGSLRVGVRCQYEKGTNCFCHQVFFVTKDSLEYLSRHHTGKIKEKNQQTREEKHGYRT